MDLVVFLVVAVVVAGVGYYLWSKSQKKHDKDSGGSSNTTPSV
jgi:drug/metabolite transporter (DMT)-like permease